MTCARSSLLPILLADAALAIVGCEAEQKPLIGYAKPPPGILIDPNNGGGAVSIWPIFDLPQTPQVFQPRLNAQNVVIETAPLAGFYDYAKWDLQGWTGGVNPILYGTPAGTYVVDFIDADGKSWGQSSPVAITDGLGLQNPAEQIPAVIFTHFDNQMASWTIDPSLQDSDPATDEITVTNLVGEDVVVERCLITGGARTSCTTVGTVSPQADLTTVETVIATTTTSPSSSSSSVDHQALFIHLASDASQSYQRDLVLPMPGTYGNNNTCQIERIMVHGTRSGAPPYAPAGSVFALSSCYGYQSGGR